MTFYWKTKREIPKDSSKNGFYKRNDFEMALPCQNGPRKALSLKKRALLPIAGDWSDENVDLFPRTN